MPIRINFLAEQQAAEELKRRDPVKRVTLAAAGLVFVFVAWSAYLQLGLLAANSDVEDVRAQFKQIEAQYRLVRTNYAVATDANRKLSGLQQLATNRFLWAAPLDALQFVQVDDVELTRLKGKQAYTLTDATPAVTNSTGVVRAKPATVRESIVLSIEAKDVSAKPGDQIRVFQQALTNHAYFRTNLQRAELMGRSAEQSDPVSNRPFVTFTLECQYPEKVR